MRQHLQAPPEVSSWSSLMGGLVKGGLVYRAWAKGLGPICVRFRTFGSFWGVLAARRRWKMLLEAVRFILPGSWATAIFLDSIRARSVLGPRAKGRVGPCICVCFVTLD